MIVLIEWIHDYFTPTYAQASYKSKFYVKNDYLNV